MIVLKCRQEFYNQQACNWSITTSAVPFEAEFKASISSFSYTHLLEDLRCWQALLMFYIFQAILWTCLSAVEQAPWGRHVKYRTPSAPYLTSSHCPQNNSTVIGFRCCGAPKPCGTAQEIQEGVERWSAWLNVVFILSLWPLGLVWIDILMPAL